MSIAILDWSYLKALGINCENLLNKDCCFGGNLSAPEAISTVVLAVKIKSGKASSVVENF